MIRDRAGVRIEPASAERREEFLAAARRSARLHHPWVSPPTTPKQFAAYLARQNGTTHLGYLAFSRSDDLVGVVNVSEIVRGVFQSAYLGFYAFAPHEGHGYMSAALSAVIGKCFRKHGLHRLEANIQPENTRSIALVRRLGFRKEGFSERYLKIDGRWRDHERWAILREGWHGASDRTN
ncbi:MAG TPA: GNAT family N-acetyltransferase [bacterium]|nr:GNAT family N-acetyltransferase [bacterium]